MDQDQEELIEIKVCFVGKTKVGKSGLVLRFSEDKFASNMNTTIGVSFVAKKIQFKTQTFKINIWDTAGQERFRSLAPLYYRDSAAVILVYAIDDMQSFTALKSWVREIKRNSLRDTIIVIAGNKCDLENQRKVPVEKGQDYADSIGAIFFETSAKTDKNVQELFQAICEKLQEQPKQEDDQIDRARGMTLTKQEDTKKEKMLSFIIEKYY